ncbi:MAG: methyltransferase domain-containing protein [Gammaproteobacteria bacterium]|jgi:phosphoethanolamine N-methyltransferase
MSETEYQEYDENLMALLEAIWGEGFMSPGGTDEVDRYLAGIELTGRKVLDIGCGLGGVDMHLARSHGARVTGIDIEQELIDRCRELADRHALGGQTEFLRVDPGPLPFADASFDIVTSKDSIIHIEDKHALAGDVFRLLEPGGWFAASDWLAGYEGDTPPEMQAYIEVEGLDFRLASAATYADALEAAGFVDIEIVDRNEWYRQEARKERDDLKGALYKGLASRVGDEFLEREVEVWDKMIVAVDLGQLRPTHLRGRKPGGPGAR